jgi:membrane-associated phospholipid phosphatase
MHPTDPDTLALWHQFTRLGEAQILLPAALLTMAVMLRQRPGRLLAAWWLGALAAAVLLTTITKVAFIGWGIGWPALDFTGISGHAMFAAAVYPLLLGALAPPRLRWPAVALGAAVALAIGVSRLVIDVHSVSEVVAGLALGGAVSGGVLLRTGLLRAGLLRAGLGGWLPVLALAWFTVTPGMAPPSQSYGLVTRLALALSGHPQPYVRGQWRTSLQGRSAAACPPHRGPEGAGACGLARPQAAATMHRWTAATP